MKFVQRDENLKKKKEIGMKITKRKGKPFGNFKNFRYKDEKAFSMGFITAAQEKEENTADLGFPESKKQRPL